jgi:hypothetical protein
MINVEETIISQYSNSPTILALIQNMNEYIDPGADIDNFYNFVWNVDSAVGFGLDIWGRIVNIGRQLTIPAAPDYFGFAQQEACANPLGQAPFWNSAISATQTYRLSDLAYRRLILAKALANITATTVPALNQLLSNFFLNRGRCYVNDLGNMQMRYTFEFAMTAYEYAIIMESGVFPRPAGVEQLVFIGIVPLFGFSQGGYSAAPFGQGVFAPPASSWAYLTQAPDVVTINSQVATVDSEIATIG